MLYIVSYDIKSEVRLKKVANICLDYGFRVQYSVFLMDLDEKYRNTFISEVKNVISLSEDKIIMIPICNGCRKSIFTLGHDSALEIPDAVII